MAEVRKKKEKENNSKKEMTAKKIEKADKNESRKKGLITKIRIFLHGVAGEYKKVYWPTKENMLKYSIATIFFIIFCGAFFYLIDVIFALIRSLF